MKRQPFELRPDQVPEYPSVDVWNWVDVLRWCVAVMDHDDEDIGFAASLLSHACKYGDLSEKQDKYAKRTVSRVEALWSAHHLACQRLPSATRLTATALETTTTEGTA